MAEYIEREALFKKALEERRFVFQMEDLINAEIVVKAVYSDFAEFVNSIPAADVAPVVHGEWIFKWDAEKDPKRLFVRIVCSECNLHTGQKSNYCPNCGARMDGGNHVE